MELFDVKFNHPQKFTSVVYEAVFCTWRLHITAVSKHNFAVLILQFMKWDGGPDLLNIVGGVLT